MAYETFKVLIIDDDRVILKLYGTSLRAQHYEVIEANDGADGLRKAFQEAPDIVLVDIMMPEVDGYEVCARLRSAPRTADIPIITLTALEGIAARQKAHEMGADDFVTKGGPPKNIDGRIKMLIKRRILAHTRSWLAELPGSVAADYSLRARLAAGLPVAACYLNLDGLAAFNERAGFQEGDRVLWQLARILLGKVAEEDGGDFVGYYGSDDFIILTTPERAEPLAQAVVRAFDATMREWSGGSPSAGGFPTLSIAIVIVEGGQAPHPGQVSDLGQSLLRQAKAEPGSAIRVARLPPAST
jgi:diguanylate cyclase (GGDEF)-like protein